MGSTRRRSKLMRLFSFGVCSQLRFTIAEEPASRKYKMMRKVADALVEQGLMRWRQHTPGVKHEVFEDQLRIDQRLDHVPVLTVAILRGL